MPENGVTFVSFYQNDELVAEVFNQPIPSLTLSDRTTSPEALGYGLLYALAEQDHELMGAQLLSIVRMAESFSLIERVAGNLQPSYKLGFPKKFYRYDLKVNDAEVSVYQNSFLAYSLVQVIKYFRNRPAAVGIDITVYDSLRAILQGIGNLIQASTDKLSAWIYDPVPSEYSTLWASIALGEILSISYERSIHATAARIFLTLDGPFQVSDEISESLIQSTRFLWAQMYGQDTSKSFAYHESHILCDQLSQFWWAALLHEEISISNPSNLAEESLSLWSESTLSLCSEPTFYLHAYEAEAFTDYLYQWAVYMWPTGRMWPSEESTNYGILYALFKMFAASAFDYALELFMLQNANRVDRLQAHYLQAYFEKPLFCSDQYWSSWIIRSKKLTDFSEKADHWGLRDFEFYQEDHLLLSADRSDQLASDLIYADEPTTDAYLNLRYKHVDVWDYPILYDHFDYNLDYTEKQFNPIRPNEVNNLFYQELTRAVDGEGDLVQDVIRPIPGFSYYLDASSDFTVESHLDITADSPFALFPLSNLSAQVKISSPPVFRKVVGLIPYGISLTICTYQTVETD